MITTISCSKLEFKSSTPSSKEPCFASVVTSRGDAVEPCNLMIPCSLATGHDSGFYPRSLRVAEYSLAMSRQTNSRGCNLCQGNSRAVSQLLLNVKDRAGFPGRWSAKTVRHQFSAFCFGSCAAGQAARYAQHGIV